MTAPTESDMRRLSVVAEVDTDMWGDGTLALLFTMLVDDREVDDASVDPDVFFEALVRDGQHPLLMCPTGVFDCCGSYARTRAMADGWLVEVENHLPSTPLDWASVIAAGRAMLEAIEVAQAEHGVVPYVPSRIENVVDRCVHYRAVLGRVEVARS